MRGASFINGIELPSDQVIRKNPGRAGAPKSRPAPTETGTERNRQMCFTITSLFDLRVSHQTKPKQKQKKNKNKNTTTK